MRKKIKQIKIYIKSHIWLQYSLVWIGLLVVSVLGLNDNYHTLAWINRIVPSYNNKGLTLFPGTIILIVAIYNLFRAFYYTTGNYLFNKGWKCLICTLIFMNVLSGINDSMVQKLRGFQSGLDAIYLDRNNLLGVNLYDISIGKEKLYRIEGFSRLKNCSNETVGPFKVTITISQDENHPGGNFTCEDSYELAPGEQKTIPLNYEGVLKDFVDSDVYEDHIYLAFEGVQMMLWNEEQQVIFYSE